jgi:hypothetical protein
MGIEIAPLHGTYLSNFFFNFVVIRLGKRFVCFGGSEIGLHSQSVPQKVGLQRKNQISKQVYTSEHALIKETKIA